MLRSLQVGNTQLGSEIAKLEGQLQSLKESPVCVYLQKEEVDTVSGDVLPQVDNKILRYKCKLMQAQLKTVSEETVLELPENIDLQYHVLRRDLIKWCTQYRECLAFLMSVKKELAKDIDSQEKVRQELTAVEEAAKMKAEETVNQKFSRDEVLKRLDGKCAAVDKVNQKRWLEMSRFLDENYPLPSPETFNQVKRKVCKMEGSIYQAMRLQDLIPLKNIVKELMTSCIENLNDPYIVLDHRYWPPYVDLLLQCDVALRHPADCNRIKLMPFHL